MSKQFRVSFTADETKLPILVGLLAGEVDGFHVQDLEKVVKPPSQARPNGIYKPKKDGKFDAARIRPVIEWPTSQRIMAILKEGGALTANDICGQMFKEGYAPATGSAVLSKLKKEGHVRALAGTNKEGKKATLFCLAQK